MHKTPDIALAIALMISGAELGGLERLKENKFLFCFEEVDGFDELVNQFWRKELVAPPQTILALSRKLKAMIKYEQKNS